ncbi:Leucine-rich_repeat domain superfamily [Hexamita inflata]|uniref:Leucine-rich repeat domain superfamily n=1 Tax=Hexamita inflata TaxID=28002 RepID=A0AA86PIZ0_9EUKA|nr:Leucine-rich repeat domain superfamily [Hexamita inflata]
MMQNLNSAIDEFANYISNSEQLIINKQQKQIKELYVDQENLIRVQELLKNNKPEKLTFSNIENIPIIINSTVKEIVILKNAAVLKQFEYKSINIENTQFTNLKVLRFQTVLCFGKIDLSFVQKLAKFTQLQELSIDNHKCTISDLTHLQFLTTLQTLNMRNSGLTNLDILVPCSNLIECNIQDTINNNNQQCQIKDGNMYILNKQLMNIDVVYNIQINNLEITSCPNIVAKFCSHSLKILSIINCKLQQIDLKDLINLEVLILQDSLINQNQLNLKSITKLEKLKYLSISGLNVDITPLQCCHNLINIQYNMCLNIDPQLICNSIKQLTITFCDINSINLQRFQELEELTLEDNYKYGENKDQNIKLVTNLMHCSKLQKLDLGKCWQVDIIPLLITLTNNNVRLPRIYNDIDYFKILFNLNKLEQVKISERSLLIPQNDKLIVDVCR